MPKPIIIVSLSFLRTLNLGRDTRYGDQKTPEQIAAEVDQRRAEVNPQYNIERAESRKEFIDNSPEAARVAIGAVTGAGEAVGSTGALVADTVAVGVEGFVVSATVVSAVDDSFFFFSPAGATFAP